MREKFNFTPDYGSKANTSNIKVIGVGGGGGNAVKHMYKEGIVGVDFLICNTDQQALYNNPVPAKLVLGSSGLGAGANPEVARELAEESAEALKEFVGAETQMLFIAAGMGKGTGTGAAPVVARIAREMNILTIGVVTFPFGYERCDQRAMAGIAEIKKHVDSLIIIHNERIFTYHSDATIKDAFGHVDDVLKNAVQCIAELITVNATVNVDFNDVKSIIANSKSAMLGIATASGENRAEEALENALHCPLLDLDMITNAKNLLFFVSCGTDEPITMNELNSITKKLAHYENKDVRVIWGHAEDASLGKAIKVSVILTDYETAEQKKKEGIIDPDKIPVHKEPETPEKEKTVFSETTGGINIPPVNPTSPDDVLEFTGENRQQPVTQGTVTVDPTPNVNPYNFNMPPQPPTIPTPPPTPQVPQTHNPFSFITQTVHEQVVLANGQVDMYTHNDDIYENDELYGNLVNTPAIQLTREHIVEDLIEKPEKIAEFNPFQNEPDNDANEFLYSWPD